MKSTIFTLFLGVVAVRAQTTTAPDYPYVGVNCGSYPPEFQAACYSSRHETPPVPAATGDPVTILGNDCLSLPIRYQQECFASRGGDYWRPPHHTGTYGPPGSDCGSLPPQYQAACRSARSEWNEPPVTIIGGDCAALPPQFQSACSASREAASTTSGWTTSTVYVTSMITISSCASTVTDCPYTKNPLTTVTVSSYTTVCPVETTTHEDVVTSDCSEGSITKEDVSTATGSGVVTKTCTHDYCHHTTETKPPCTHDYCKHSDTATPTTTYAQVTAAAGRREAGVLGMVAGLAVALL